jgi:hypothetical protein
MSPCEFPLSCVCGQDSQKQRPIAAVARIMKRGIRPLSRRNPERCAAAKISGACWRFPCAEIIERFVIDDSWNAQSL